MTYNVFGGTLNPAQSNLRTEIGKSHYKAYNILLIRMKIFT